MLDDPAMEVGYLILLVVSWAWTLSQLRFAINHGGAWRWITTYWLVSKSSFFSVAAYIWWFNDMPETIFSHALYNLVLAHVIAFVMWLRLPKSNALAPDPSNTGFTDRV